MGPLNTGGMGIVMGRKPFRYGSGGLRVIKAAPGAPGL